ncbi:hypothetical protein KL86DES1_20563 [uncultured Desulfovibrio sp.]|uniref:Uncharacterized protein n=1 Tax=uncultured Desulfovibrio sp. TaxID=167968 RepID=A0A212L4U8_9BACT|nr:hypothetical protein KL86DES1_20563 [uncultured Desulfovibrio sp.]VZH33467.1 conserved protein of unknown function [Desulfovibrio sp. 86]
MRRPRPGGQEPAGNGHAESFWRDPARPCLEATHTALIFNGVMSKLHRVLPDAIVCYSVRFA